MTTLDSRHAMAPRPARPAPPVTPVDALRGLIGDLADVVDLLVDRETGPRASPGRLVVLVDLRWDADLSAMPPADRPTLPLYGLRGRLVLGPLVEPGRVGCPHCLALRVRASDHPDDALTAPPHGWRRLSSRSDAAQWWPPGALRLMAAVIRHEAAEPGRSVDAAYVIDTGGLLGRWRPALAHALCRAPHCADNATPIPPPLPDLRGPLPATGAGSARRFSVEHFADRLEAEYLDPWSGVTRAPAVAGNAALPSIQVDVPTTWGFDEIAIGRADDYATARSAAVLEGLERYAGWHCGGRDPVRFAAYGDLGPDVAIDPRTLLPHEDEAYRTPGFGYVRFTEDTPTGWARAHSVATGRPALVPFHVAYYGAAKRADTGPAFVCENSNGCALGAGPEEALLAGMLEVAERDAFLCAWYSRTSLPELDLDALPDSARSEVRAVRHHTGRRLRAFLAVGEFAVPVAIVVSTSDDPLLPATLVTAGSGLTVAGAVVAALREMAAAAPAITIDYDRRRHELAPMLREPDLVREMADHALVGALPESLPRFDFLLDGTAPPVPRAPLHVPRGDVAADLAAMLDVAARAGREVLVVDHTTTELHRLGLRCVKAIVPGTAPMTFGHRHRRLPTADTVRAFRARQGFPDGTPSGEEVRHDPHPFP